MTQTSQRSRPQLRPPASPTEQLWQLRTIGFFAMLLTFGPPAVVMGVVLYMLAHHTAQGAAARSARSMLWVTLGGIIGIGTLYLFREAAILQLNAVIATFKTTSLAPIAQSGSSSGGGNIPEFDPTAQLAPLFAHAFPHLLQLWFTLLLTAPLVALFLDITRVRQADEIERARHEYAYRQDRVAAQRARTQATKAPAIASGQMVLGVPISGDLGWTQDRWLTYPPNVLGRHLVVIGGSGTGKTETSIRLAYGAAKAYGWKIFYLDCKGDEETADRFQGAMRAAGCANIMRFPDHAYDGWRGDSVALFNRLIANLDYTEPYYRDMTKMILDLAVNAPPGPPRSSDDLLARLNLAELKKRYNRSPDGQAIEGIKAEHIHSAHNRYRAFFRALAGGLDGSWAFEDVDAGYILLRGLELKDQTASIGRFLMEDFAHYVSKRKPPAQRILLIVDEFPAIAFGGANTATLFEMVRSKGAGVVVTAQSYAGMGDGADRILGAAAGLLLHQCADPERLLSRAGQQTTYARSVAFVERSASDVPSAYATGAGSISEREELKIHPNTVKSLTPGECFMVSGGLYQHVCVAQLHPEPPASQPSVLPSSPWQVEQAPHATSFSTTSDEPPSGDTAARVPDDPLLTSDVRVDAVPEI